MDWHRLDRDKSLSVINSVRSTAEAVLFSPATSEVKCARLPFYKNHLVYRLTNFSSMPIFTMDFIGDGENYVYIDGSNQPIEEVNTAFGINLTRETLLPYLNFYFLNVRGEDGDILILRNVDEGQTIDLYDDERREDMDLEPDDAIVDMSADNSWNLRAPIYYLGGLVDASINVTAQGRVTIKPLKMLTSGI